MRLPDTTEVPTWWVGLCDLLCPPRCIACDEPCVGGQTFCGGCGPLLEPVDRTLSPPARSAALFMYGGPLADALQRLKYGGRVEVAAHLAKLLAEAAGAYVGRVDRLVPLPLHPAKLRERGFNQVAVLARPLARRLGVPFDVGALRRVRRTAPQAGLEREARLANVRGAFRCRSGVDDRILLVDDVRTSGATLAEAALTLRAGGAAQVYTLALAFAQA